MEVDGAFCVEVAAKVGASPAVVVESVVTNGRAGDARKPGTSIQEEPVDFWRGVEPVILDNGRNNE